MLVISAAGFGGGLGEGGGIDLVAGGTPDSAGFAGGVFLYDTDNGRLSFDADGQAAGAAVLVATLTSRPTLGVADFLVIA